MRVLNGGMELKTIKEETYKGYNIKTGVEFKECSGRERPLGSDIPTIIYDSVFLEVTARPENVFTLPQIREKAKITKKQDKHEEIYKDLYDEIANKTEKVKLKIDQKIREREITDGLPESLLKETDKSFLVSDRYKTAIDNLNIYIKQQQEMQDKYPVYSKEYKKHLENEIALQKDKMNILKKREESLSGLIENKPFTGNWFGVGKVTTLHPKEDVLSAVNTFNINDVDISKLIESLRKAVEESSKF